MNGKNRSGVIILIMKRDSSESFFYMRNRFCLNWFKTIDEAYLCITDLKKNNVYNGEIVLSFEYLARGSRFLL